MRNTEQKEDLDKIETHTASAEARVEEGVQELTVVRPNAPIGILLKAKIA